ncbi:MarR family winged helix-turn-helix transcriptional regulator [Actinomycetospora sp. C-140]
MTETRWLDDDERAAWVLLCKVLLVLPGALESQLVRDADLTLFGYMILARLSVSPEETLPISALAEMANGSLSRTSHAVTRLEQRGWIRRTVCPGTGRRYTVATLTEEGRATLTAAAPGHVETVRRLVVDPLGPERTVALGAACATIAETLGLPTEPLA